MTISWTSVLRLTAVFACAGLLVACGEAPVKVKVTPDPRLATDAGGSRNSDTQNAGSGLSGTVEVWADNAYKDALNEVKEEFKVNNGNVVIILTFGTSMTLADRAVDKSNADVFFSANAEAMKKLVDGELLIGRPQVIAKGADDGAAYEVAVLKRTEVQLAAEGFVGFTKSGPGAEILRKQGLST